MRRAGGLFSGGLAVILLLGLAHGCAAPPGPPPRRGLEELINLEEPGIALLRQWAARAPHSVVFLPGNLAAGERNLLTLQVTTRSPVGAIAYGTGGILVDDGWLRILGSGSERLPRAIADWNRLEGPREEQRLPGALLVADDALGGFFALNGGRFPGPIGGVHYLAPDTGQWTDLGLSFSDWLQAVFSERLESFYTDLRWPGWRDEVRALRGDQGISVYPLLEAAGPPIQDRSRSAVPIEELWTAHASERR